MSESLYHLVLLIAIAALDILLAAARSAMVNSRQEQLADWREAGVLGAGLAARVASNATNLMTSLRIGQQFLRLVVVALAVGLVLPSPWPGMDPRVAIAGVIVLAGLAIGLLEFGVENLVLREPERWAVRLSLPAAAAVWLFRPAGWLLQRGGAWLAGPAGKRRHPLVTEEAIMTLVDAGEEGGVIEEEEKAMIYSIFQLGDTLAREVMVPRTDILAFEESASLAEAADALLKSGHSRAPVFSATIDSIIGLLYAKDLLAVWRRGAQDQPVRNLIREAYFVPEAKKVDELLEEMQARRVHMAIVVDEYGGTAGLVTIEDIVEEIIGEIRDEYDQGEELPYTLLQDGAYLFNGRIPLDDVARLMGVDLPKEVGDTLGGLILSRLGRVPSVGETLEVGGMRLVVEQVSEKRIRKVRASRAQTPLPETESDADHTSVEG